MQRRAFLAAAGSAVVGGCAAAGSDGDGETTAGTTTAWAGWVQEGGLEDGYTAVHISRDWAVVDASETRDWDADEVTRFRRGACERYLVYERVPEGYNLYTQGRCEEGVVVTVENADGAVVEQLTLPPTDPQTAHSDSPS